MFIPVMKGGEKDEFFMIKNWHYKFWTHLVELRTISCTRTQKSKLIVLHWYPNQMFFSMKPWTFEMFSTESYLMLAMAVIAWVGDEAFKKQCFVVGFLECFMKRRN